MGQLSRSARHLSRSALRRGGGGTRRRGDGRLPGPRPLPAAAGPKSTNPGGPKIFGPAEGCRHTFQVSIFPGRLTSHLNAREEVRTMMDQYKCGKCGKSAPKAGFCCGAPMKKVS